MQANVREAVLAYLLHRVPVADQLAITAVVADVWPLTSEVTVRDEDAGLRAAIVQEIDAMHLQVSSNKCQRSGTSKTHYSYHKGRRLLLHGLHHLLSLLRSFSSWCYGKYCGIIVDVGERLLSTSKIVRVRFCFDSVLLYDIHNFFSQKKHTRHLQLCVRSAASPCPWSIYTLDC